VIGINGINGIGALLGNVHVNPNKYVKHIDYILQLIDSQHVALGMDEIFFPEIMNDYIQENAVNYSKEYFNNDKNPSILIKTAENYTQPKQD
jgi:microsomal dipeptidase-like Zn-dependent dipeptidase